MRLINVKTLQLEEFTTSLPPPYIALSHTWGNDELTLHEFAGAIPPIRTSGLQKVLDFCEAVKSRATSAIEYVWVDTCCIDKRSSAELSEAINSMFHWYRESKCCYALLSDVEYDTAADELGGDFDKARWFKRGFTLQELLAPDEVDFFDKSWRYIGNRTALAERISKATTIPTNMLLNGQYERASIAQRMSWAAKRQTTRPEDVAYCLLGLFDVNMPLLYGEGNKAFIRLQEEILRGSEDQSIFAWDASKWVCSTGSVGVLAPSPAYFEDSGNISALSLPMGGDPFISSKGISITLSLQGTDPKCSDVAILSCLFDGDLGSRVGIPVWRFTSNKALCIRKNVKLERVQVFAPSTLAAAKERITFDRGYRFVYLLSSGPRCLIRYEPDASSHWEWKGCNSDDLDMAWTHARDTQSLTLEAPPWSSIWNCNTISITHVFEYNTEPLGRTKVKKKTCFGLRLWLKACFVNSRVELIDLTSSTRRKKCTIRQEDLRTPTECPRNRALVNPRNNVKDVIQMTSKGSRASLNLGVMRLTASVHNTYAYGTPMLLVRLQESRKVK